MTTAARESMSARIGDGLAAGAAGAVLSELPSTGLALAGRSAPLEATLAAGTLLLPHERQRMRLILAAIPVHLALSLGWGLVLSHGLPRRGTRVLGALAGLAIAAFDLAVVGRRFARIAALPRLPQIADHLAFGAVVGHVLQRRRAVRLGACRD
jgi:hypothetical protein